MGSVSSRPTAGQASVEYVAALALLAVVFAVAAPAVGAPDIPRALVGKLRLALCFVVDDVCTASAARAAGLEPCALRSDTTGREASVTAFSVDVGGRWTLTVTPLSDGSVAVVRTASGGAGLLVSSPGLSGGFGPVAIEVGASGGARLRVQAARGWVFPDMASARRFIDRAERDGASGPDQAAAAWTAVEGGQDVSTGIGAALGVRGFAEQLQLFNATAFKTKALGARFAPGTVTLYGRMERGSELALPFVGSVASTGSEETLVEYTFGRDGPRQLAFRRVDGRGNRSVETVMRLDLRDPGNRAVARALLDIEMPWPPAARERIAAVFERIATHGTIERSVFEIDDDSAGFSGSVRSGVTFGAGTKRIRIHKRLVSATARTGGRARERFDCASA